MKLNTKIFAIIVFTLVIVLIGAFIYKVNKNNEYSKNINFMGRDISIKIYTTNEKKANAIFNNIEDIYVTYDNLINHKKEYKGNLYMLNNGSTSIDYRLHKIIEYGYIWYQKSNGILNFSNGNLNDIIVNEVISDNERIMVDKSVILSNNINLNLDNIAPGYINDIVVNYLKSNGITKYMINAGNNIFLGDTFDNKLYNVGIVNPLEDNIYKVIKGKNIAISSITKYSNIYNPKTLETPNKVAGVTIISNNSMDATALANILFLMDVNDATNFIKDYDVEVIWFLNDGTVKTTNGITKYE